jgi:uncharacterized delta-60 repeat protein
MIGAQSMNPGSIVALSAIASLFLTSHAIGMIGLAWAQQIGTTTTEQGRGVAADASGNVYLAAHTLGSFGTPTFRGFDAVLTRYSPNGNRAWTQQIGTGVDDFTSGVATDAAGNIYLSGSTYGRMDGPGFGNGDAFLSRLNSSGEVVWTRQIGTGSYDYSTGIAAAPTGHVVMSGTTFGSLARPNSSNSDAILVRYDPDGTLAWSRQIGTQSNDQAGSVAIDAAGNSYLSGATFGSLGAPNAGGYDAFLSRFDANGTLVWTRQIGTTFADKAYDVTVDAAGNAYLCGETGESAFDPGTGNIDAFLTRINADGSLAWTRQLGSAATDVGTAVSVDASGQVYVSGYSRGLVGSLQAGDWDTFVARYAPDGTLEWTHQFGTSASDTSWDLVATPTGEVFVGGTTYGSLGGPATGDSDAFVVKLLVPEPTAMAITVAVSITSFAEACNANSPSFRRWIESGNWHCNASRAEAAEASALCSFMTASC